MATFARRLRPRHVAGALLVVPALGLWLAFYSARQNAVWISSQGRIRHSVEWQIPLTTLIYSARNEDRDTIVARVLKAHGIKASSEQWTLVQRSGHGVRCELGAGYENLRAVESRVVAQFVGCVLRFGSPSDQELVQAWIFRTDVSVWHEGELLSANWPSEGFAQLDDFSHWWLDHRSQILAPRNSTP